MRTALRIVPALLLAVACQPAAPAPGGLTDQDRAAINQKTDAFSKAVNAHDWAAATDPYYTDDAIMMPSNGPEVGGKANIKAWMAAYPSFSDFSSHAVEIEGSGGWAYARGRYAMKLMMGGAAVADSGKYLEIWKKQADGSWSVARDIFNSDVPMPMPEMSKMPMKKP
jgi:ketosteroid isomerase-like protein